MPTCARLGIADMAVGKNNPVRALVEFIIYKDNNQTTKKQIYDFKL